MGFTFDDTDTKGVATPIAEMERILADHPEYREVIFPYVGGEEVNTSPTHAHHRYVINFGDRSEGQCRKRWQDLMAIVEAKVKPERMQNNREGYRRYWWQYGEKRVELHAAASLLSRVLVCSSVSKHFALAWRPSTYTFSHNVNVFALESDCAFSVRQSRVHECFAATFSSTLEDRQGYRGSDCFETFPFPEGWENHPTLDAAGKAYYDFRAALMVRNSEGLTKTYNRFHDPDERAPEILKLRELHAAMDRAVIDAYGWSSIDTTCDFLLDYEIDEEEWGDRKKPWRYRWPDEVQAEVLARLLELNAERAQAQAQAGAAAAGAAQKPDKARPRKPKAAPESGSSPMLFETKER